MTVLIIAEHDGKILKPSTLSAITAAQHLSSDIDILVAGNTCHSVIDQACTIQGIRSVLAALDPSLEHPTPEALASLVLSQAKEYAYICAPATTFGKNFLPRVAALLDVMQISDVIKIISQDTFERPIYAGNAIATVQSKDHTKVLTIRPTAFPGASFGESKAPLKKIESIPSFSESTFVKLEASSSERPELTSARIVVSGGRGLQSSENFKMIEELADCLHGAVGASRAAVDAGYVPNDYQVGQTGKVVAPDLYIAIGISGAIQHLAGMKDSKVIVAINKDPDAPIFQIADYGLVGDLFEIVPQLTKELKQLCK